MGMTALGLAAAVLGSLSSTGHAAKFRLEVTRGADQPVCQAYANGRNSRGDRGIAICFAGEAFRSNLVSRPVVPLSAHVVFEDFDPREPVTEVQRDLSALYFQHIEPFSRRYDIRLSHYFDGPSARDWRGTPDQVRRAESVVREFTLRQLVGVAPIIEIDVDNDGRAEPVFFYERSLVKESRSLEVGSIGAPIILSADRRSIDMRRTLRIFRSSVPYDRRVNWRTLPDGTDVRVRDFLLASDFGVFRYAGKNFIDFKWAGTGYPVRAVNPERTSTQPIRIYLATRSRVSQVCELVCVEETAP
jgi:hypothetical protein